MKSIRMHIQCPFWKAGSDKMLLLNINGPINAGKTTVSKILQTKLPNSLFIEVDELMSDEEQEKLHLSRESGWEERIRRLGQKLAECKANRQYDIVIWAYPIGANSYRRWVAFGDENTLFLNITLAPSLDICLKDRGTRKLLKSEQERIKEMYQKGYQARPYSDFTICNDNQTPEETADIIIGFIKHVSDKSTQWLHLVERRWPALLRGEKISTYRLNEGFIRKGFLVYKDCPKEQYKEVVYVTNVYYGPLIKAMKIDGFDDHTPDLETGLKQLQAHYPNITAETNILWAKHLSVPETKRKYPKEVEKILNDLK